MVSRRRATDMTTLDRIVWRINGWMILVTGALVGLLAFYGLYRAAKEATRERYRKDEPVVRAKPVAAFLFVA